jgi:hypothetical protein
VTRKQPEHSPAATFAAYDAPRVLALGAICFAAAYLWFAIGPVGVLALAPAVVLAGIGIGCAETAEHAAVATLASGEIKGSAFGLLAGIQAAGTSPHPPSRGVLWTAASPGAAFIFLAVAMGIATPLIIISTRT